MSCCDGWEATPRATVGLCPDCEGEIDSDGDSTEEGCNYSPEVCKTCGYAPCDQGC